MIYLDNAATTKPNAKVLETANYFSSENFFNASSIYVEGIKVNSEISKARNVILNKLNALNYNLIFTSGATEANNIAIFQATKTKSRGVITTNAEHPSVLNSVKNLENSGQKVYYAKLKPTGEVDVECVLNLVKSNNIGFISIMLVSNETGAVNNISKIFAEIKKFDNSIITHSDIVQGFCKCPIDLTTLKADLVTVSAHKIYGLKGTGALIYNSKFNVKPQVFGGGQEFNLRAGTENVAGIMAFKEAVEGFNDDISHIKNLKNIFITEVENYNKTAKQKIKINSEETFSPYILSLSAAGVKSEIVLRLMNEKGILISSGSACSSKRANNLTLFEMGLTKPEIEGSNRISFGTFNTEEEVKLASKTYLEIIKDLTK